MASEVSGNTPDEKVAKTQLQIVCVVLAAGSSSRMGQQKLVLPLEDGEPLIRRVMETASGAHFSARIVVVSSDDESVREVTRHPLWQQVLNLNAKEGMSTSLRAGVTAAEATGADAVVILLGDQPGVTVHHVQAVVEGYQRDRALIVQASYQGEPSHPILFDRALFGELMQVTGDEGGRSVVWAHPADRRLVALLDDTPVDLDTPAAYEAWLAEHRPVDDV
ncbi:nucleotidyltransferase family protein [Alicyclobacillus ferrooxydans]|nr:nucleotidyltransferase family protein [Alicyclobacillus ferrooxydans]